MKIRGQLKLLSLVALLIILNDKVSGQNTSFVPDAKKDSIWLQQSLITANKLHQVNRDSVGVVHGKWIKGRVLYSPDGSLKATQLIAGPDTFTTTIQYLYRGKIFKQDFNYKPDFSNYTLNGIYKLPGESPAYVFLLSKTEYVPDYERDWLSDFLKTSHFPNDADFKHIQRQEYVAAAFRFEKDSLFETTFPLTTSQEADTANIENTKSFGFTSDIVQSKQAPRPFLKYDPLSGKLSFLDISYKIDEANDTSFFMNVESAAFEYRDTSFVLANDTPYYYPSLKSLAKTIARRNYKAGKYVIKALATKSYEDFGNDILPVLTVKYQIGTQTLNTVNNDDYDGGDKVNIKPDYRIQNNGSLILLLTDQTNGHGPGMCGAATSDDANFWLINNKSPQRLFSFSYGSCSSTVSYTFTQNGKEISGDFYLDDPSDKDGVNFEDSHWINNSTYVFVVADNEAGSLRNFYLHFNPANKKNPVTLKAGKLYKEKKQTSQ